MHRALHSWCAGGSAPHQPGAPYVPAGGGVPAAGSVTATAARIPAVLTCLTGGGCGYEHSPWQRFGICLIVDFGPRVTN
jgi:hypothetical protein